MPNDTHPSPPELPPLEELPPLRGRHPALVTGRGVPALTIIKPEPKPAPKTPSTVSLDPVEEWIDQPMLKDQLENPALYRLDKREVRIFDLSQPEQLAAYNTLLAQASAPGTNLLVMDEQKQFATTRENWMVLVTLQWVKFRRLLEKEKS
jgi:hypothetical protein